MSQHAPARTHGLQHRDAMEWLISCETSAAITSYAIRTGGSGRGRFRVRGSRDDSSKGEG